MTDPPAVRPSSRRRHSVSAHKTGEGLRTPPLRNPEISSQVPLYFPQNVLDLEIGQKLVVRSARKSGSQPASFQGIRNTPTASRNRKLTLLTIPNRNKYD